LFAEGAYFHDLGLLLAAVRASAIILRNLSHCTSPMLVGVRGALAPRSVRIGVDVPAAFLGPLGEPGVNLGLDPGDSRSSHPDTAWEPPGSLPAEQADVADADAQLHEVVAAQHNSLGHRLSFRFFSHLGFLHFRVEMK